MLQYSFLSSYRRSLLGIDAVRDWMVFFSGNSIGFSHVDTAYPGQASQRVERPVHVTKSSPPTTPSSCPFSFQGHWSQSSQCSLGALCISVPWPQIFPHTYTEFASPSSLPHAHKLPPEVEGFETLSAPILRW